MWITAILALSLMACSQEPASPDKEDKLRVGYITMDMTSPYFINMIDGMKEKAKELDAVDEALIKIKEGGIYRGTVDIAPFESGKIIIESTKKGY